MNFRKMPFRIFCVALVAILTLTAAHTLTTRVQARAQMIAFEQWEAETYASGSPIGRHEAAMINVDGKFYLMGGRETSMVQEYDPITRTWTNISNGPADINHFQPVEVDGLVYVLGSFNDAFPNDFPDEIPVAEIYIFDPATGNWSTSPHQVPEGRRRGSAGAVVYNGKIYLVGGNELGHNPQFVAWFDEYDPATGNWTILPDAPTARDHFNAVVIGDQLIIAGGRQTKLGGNPETFEDVIAEVDVYNFTTGQWNTLPETSNIPTPRAGAMNVTFGNEVIVVGGETTQGSAHDEVEALDITTGQWRTLDNLINGRHSGGTVINSNCIYTVTGSESRAATSGTILDTMERYTFPTPNTGLNINITNVDVTVGEAAGTATLELTFTASDCQNVPSQTISVDYATSNGSATAGQDYTAVNDTLTMQAGENQATITIPITADTLDENSESFTVTLSNPTNVSIGTSTATITITDDDDPPTLSVDDITVGEADGTATFTVSLNHASGKAISVMYATSDDSATAGQDYTATSGTVNIPVGNTSATFTVPILNDTIDEGNDEQFLVTLSSPTNASLADAQGVGTIVDDETVNIYMENTAVAIAENSGNAQLSVRLSRASTEVVTVEYASADGTAIAGEDYTAVSGTLTFTIGMTETAILLPLTNDAVYEDDETAAITLSNPQSNANVNLTPANDTTTVTITNDDPFPTAALDSENYLTLEGSTVIATIQLSNPADRLIELPISTADGTATTPADYTAVNAIASFNPFQTEQTVTLIIADDETAEMTETFTLTVGDTTAVVTIVDNDEGVQQIFLPLITALAD